MASQKAAGRLGVGVIGAGKVGVVLAAALAGVGHQLIGVHARSEAGVERVQALLPNAQILSINELVERSELVVIAVPRAELCQLVSELAAENRWQPGQLIVHTVAELGTEILTPAVERGAIALAIHPIMEFTGTSMDLHRLKQSWFAVTAAAPVLPIAQALSVELGAEPLVIAEEDRLEFADTVQTVREFAQSVVNQSKSKLQQLGVDQPAKVLAQLFHSAIDKVLPEAITDPIAAFDFDSQSGLADDSAF